MLQPSIFQLAWVSLKKNKKENVIHTFESAVRDNKVWGRHYYFEFVLGYKRMDFNSLTLLKNLRKSNIYVHILETEIRCLKRCSIIEAETPLNFAHLGSINRHVALESQLHIFEFYYWDLYHLLHSLNFRSNFLWFYYYNQVVWGGLRHIIIVSKSNPD